MSIQSSVKKIVLCMNNTVRLFVHCFEDSHFSIPLRLCITVSETDVIKIPVLHVYLVRLSQQNGRTDLD